MGKVIKIDPTMTKALRILRRCTPETIELAMQNLERAQRRQQEVIDSALMDDKEKPDA